MTRAMILCLAASLAVSGCAVAGRDNFKKQAYSKEGTFQVGYQELYRCFTNQVALGGSGNLTGTAQLFSDLKTGEYRVGNQDNYLALVEFKGTGEKETRVSAYAVHELDRNIMWRKVESCASNTSA